MGSSAVGCSPSDTGIANEVEDERGADAGDAGHDDYFDDDDAGNPSGERDGGDGGIDGYPPCEPDGSCPQGAICRYEVCIPDRGTCHDNGDCPGDSYCDPDAPPNAGGVCVPYGVPPGKINDEECKKLIDPGEVLPIEQCEWEDADEDDPTHGYNRIYTSPVVADLNLDHDPDRLRPSIVVTTFGAGGHYPSMLRVFDGRTCQEQMRIGGPDDPERVANHPAYATQWAIGDLDGDVGNAIDGHPEIVGFGRVGPGNASDEPLTVRAFGIDTSDIDNPQLFRKWDGRICHPSDPSLDEPVTFGSALANSGPGIWDLDDDGVPEVVADTMVFDNEGCLLNPPATWLNYLRHGIHSTIADADHDGRPDLVRYDGIYEWKTSTAHWERKDFFVSDPEAHKPGHVAIADMGNFSSLPGKAGEKLPEVVVVSAESMEFMPNSTGTVRMQTLTGEVVFGPIELFHHYDGVSNTTNYGGHGGPPTIGDFDGDGWPEIGVAANQFYVVYDPDCTIDGTPLPQRPGGRCDRSRVVLPDEVDELPPGILWAKLSRDYSSSGTGSSIFDFNGDGVAEAVYRDECFLRVYDGPTGDVIFSVPARSGTGQEFPVIADVNGNFATQIVVTRAGNPAGCPGVDPLLPGDPEAPIKTTGFAVLRDAEDRWASSRPIWNQHAYSVTNVLDDGRIPRSSDVQRNWEVPGLNNFRQNVQGSLGALQLADITVELADLPTVCAWQSGTFTLVAKVCNRGTNRVTDGVEIRFEQRDKDAKGSETLVCETETPKLLDVGECTLVSCEGELDGQRDLVVKADPNEKIADCHPGNNEGASALVLCPEVK